MNLRQRSRRINYAELNEGKNFHQRCGPKSKKAERWSSTQLWPLEVIEEGDNSMKVHYIGWPNKYDEWIPKNKVVLIPKELEESRDDFGFLKQQLYIQVNI